VHLAFTNVNAWKINSLANAALLARIRWYTESAPERCDVKRAENKGQAKTGVETRFACTLRCGDRQGSALRSDERAKTARP
jgi:hypothetical protein